jgi:hypothetical protein
MTYIVRHKRGTTDQWSTSTYVLKDGEMGIDKTLNKIKIGNGSSLWSALPYVNAVPSEISEMSQDAIWAAVNHNDHNHVSVSYDDVANKIIFSTEPEVVINSGLTNTLGDYLTTSAFNTQLDEPNGTPTLDANGLIRDSQIPSTIARDTEVSSAISTEVTNRNLAISTAISTEISNRNSAIDTAISTEVVNRNTAINTSISNIIDAAPTALDTLKELATAINNDSSYASTITTALATKEPLLPSQSGNSGKFLTTDGSSKFWSTVAQYTLPTQTNNSGKFLTTNGTVESWAVIPVTSTATATSKGTVYGFSSDTDAGSANVSYGWRSMANVTSGTDNLAIGFQTMYGMTTGINNLAMGKYALSAASSSSSNTAIGMWTLNQATSGSGNVAIGPFVMYNTTIGNENVAISQNALNYTNGDGNIGIGSSAGNALTTGSNNIIIGTYSNASSPTTSNQITLGDSRITSFRIPGLAVDWSTSAYGRATWASTSTPSGGNDGDTWLVYTP